MRLVVTGGGTGGHIYPALEVARLAQEQGAEFVYYGSYRGQEGAICHSRGIDFVGFSALPLVSLRTGAGWKALAALLRARSAAKHALRRLRPDAVFSTGGYSAAPVMAAAASLRIPYTIHEANSVPGRSNRLFGKRAAAFTCTFRHTEGLELGFPVERTGQPVRAALREAARQLAPRASQQVLAIGGSQGSAFLNDLVPQAFRHMPPGTEVWHSVGRGNAGLLESPLLQEPGYHASAYLEAEDLIEAYRRVGLAVGRSGGTLAEFAVFRLPSILVPLPSAADDHQTHNAKEFQQMGAADLLPQAEATPDRLAALVAAWQESGERQSRAAAALADWDIPDATERIVGRLMRAGARG